MLWKYSDGHACKKKMLKPRNHETSTTRDDLIYTYEAGTYRLFKVMEENERDEMFECKEFNIKGKVFKRTASLDFGLVGCFLNHGFLLQNQYVYKKEIVGKCVMYRNYLFTLHNDVLVEE